MDYQKTLKNKIQELKAKNLYRHYPLITQDPQNPPYGTLITDAEKRKVTIWGNNNYLSLTSHPKIAEALKQGIDDYGTGSSGTRNILGTSLLTENLEAKISEMHNKQASLIHNSALSANIGVLSAIGKNFENAIFLSDEKNHASIIDGIKLSGADKSIFKHRDIKDLEQKITQARDTQATRPIFVVIESIYSMSGDIFPLEQLIVLKKKHNLYIILDEVHATGIYGEKGGGYAQYLGLEDDIDLIIGTFGKALGLSGGFVTGEKTMIDFLRHHSRTHIFTTSIPPYLAKACAVAIDIISSEEGKTLRKTHQNAVAKTKKQLTKNQINFHKNQTHIIPIIIGNEQKCRELTDHLLYAKNIAVTPIFYPTVAKGNSIIRLNPTPNHTEQMILELVEAFKEL